MCSGRDRSPPRTVSSMTPPIHERIITSPGVSPSLGPKPKSTDVRADVGNWVITGLVVLTMSFVGRDPGCVKTPARIMIPLVILGGEIDEAVRFGDGSCAIHAFARMP